MRLLLSLSRSFVSTYFLTYPFVVPSALYTVMMWFTSLVGILFIRTYVASMLLLVQPLSSRTSALLDTIDPSCCMNARKSICGLGEAFTLATRARRVSRGVPGAKHGSLSLEHFFPLEESVTLLSRGFKNPRRRLPPP